MSGTSWSLAGRLTAIFVLSALVVAMASAAISGWFVRASVESELEALANELVSEFEAYLPAGPDSDEPTLREAADRLLEGHAQTPLALRVWRTATGEVAGTFGELGLVTPTRPGQTPTTDLQAESALRWLSRKLTDHPLVVGVVLDGSAKLALVERFDLTTILRLLIITGIAFALCRFLLRRVARQLLRVAENVRADRDPTTDEEIALHAPEEIRAVAEALRDRMNALQGELRRQQVFTAGLAHELRSPIQNLLGETEVALLAERDAPTYRRVLESHLLELREFGDAIDNLMTMLSAQSKGPGFAREEFDLAAEAELRLRREETRAREQGVTLHIERRGDLCIFGDREALLRALRNLVANAIEWSPRDGRVEVLLTGREHEVEVSVRDSGPGVAPELEAHIFEPFFQGPAKRGKRVGYGLGLAIVRAAVEGQGGTIEIGRAELGGASFRLTLPRRVRRAGALER